MKKVILFLGIFFMSFLGYSENFKGTDKEFMEIFNPNFDTFTKKDGSVYTGKIEVTDNSYSIHHFAGSWLEVPKYEEIETKFWKLFGLKNLNIINKIIWRFK